MTSNKNNFGKRKSYYREKKMTYAGNNFHREKMAFEEKRKNFEEEKIRCCRKMHGLRREKKVF